MAKKARRDRVSEFKLVCDILNLCNKRKVELLKMLNFIMSIRFLYLNLIT